MRRKAAGLSQEALAHAVGITKNHMQLLEAGRGGSGADGPVSNPRMSTLYGLAHALGTTPVELLPSTTEDPEVTVEPKRT
jgi:transcriptional regulator with XRE-family HTH domain